MPVPYEAILEQYTKEIQKIFGNHLKAVILYGSYARGDYRPDSDIDIMVLADLDEKDLKLYSRKLSDITYDMNMDNDMLIMPIVKNEGQFEYWKQAYPFYTNVAKEGVRLYAS